MTLQAILNSSQASFDHFNLNRDAWSLVRGCCKDLLGAEELERYRQLYDESNNDENRQFEWADLLEKFDPDDEYVSVYKVDMISMMILRKRQS